jgi:UbiA prenyltransferase family
VTRSTFNDFGRTLLVLGRISNLPTVWSNLLAGWILAGGIFNLEALSPLLLGASLLYIGGMYLNDYCDADFDARYRPERPIPAKHISRRAVGLLSNLWFACGLGCLAALGSTTIVVALLLLAAIVFYDFRHKNVVWAPLVMGICRGILYPLAASATDNTVPSWYVISKGSVLSLYVVGVTYLARGESGFGKPMRWAVLLLFLPSVISLVAYAHEPGAYWPVGSLCVLISIWIWCLLVPLCHNPDRSIGRVIPGLLAGIVLVDMIAVAPILGFEATYLTPLFLSALFLQRVIPAS